jgi:hypothetical protein
MTEPLLISRQRAALQDLYRLIAERTRTEPQIEGDFQSRKEAIEKEFQEATHKVITRFESEKEISQREFQEAQHKISKRFEKERAAQDKEWVAARQRITQQFETDSEAAKNELLEAKRAVAKALKVSKGKAEAEVAEAEEKIAAARGTAERLQEEAVDLLKTWRQYRNYGELPDADQPDRIYQDAFRQVEECVATVEKEHGELKDLRLPPLFQGMTFFGYVFVLMVVAGGAGAWLASKDTRIVALASGVGSALVVGIFMGLYLYTVAGGQVKETYQRLRQAILFLKAACTRARDQAQTTYENQCANADKLAEKELKHVTEKHRKKQESYQERRDTEWSQAEEKYKKAVADTTQRRDTDLRQAHEKYQKLRADILARYETDSHQIHERHYKLSTESKQRYENEWQALVENWRQGLARFHAVAEEVNRESSSLFPAWSDPFWKQWVPSTTVPPGIRFGDYGVDLAQIPDGLPADERLKPAVPVQHSFPALMSFPDRCSLLIKTNPQGRVPALQALEVAMLRYLTALPPGKVRFTILDPVGLGEEFGAFMHLADYDEALVTSRVWTELAHIEQRLSDLTQHMENVLQKYLRNLYKTIEEYNQQAGEVAEPYRILVVANFPVNFGAEAARRLISIVSSGPRCGVYALISVDTTQEMPQGFSLAALEHYTVNLEWKEGRFVWQDEDFAPFPLQIEALPPMDFCTRLLHEVGAKAREAKRVEVPFDFIAPKPESWWTSDSRTGVDVALGRAGVTKRQHLKLGHGTSQHVLIAGKTGSGKSTLLHALITNTSLLYSPDEIELYLIDFKKGVEFKTYAAFQLPHARVVAIESEREFGLSVLQRLDVELKIRGEKFRETGAQDVNAFRELNPNVKMPRILLIVDEFQEFFTEDDRVAQEASQLLDRLVRQGRAFGLHVLLGSQTLGGAYSLARSTIDQMAVRIALQCSEADGHLILSDDNSAARLLSRPGEAIYNDANGLVEGNNPFQVVWLPEPRREDFLQRLGDLHHKRYSGVSRTQIVFEGNAPADTGKNVFLQQLLTAPTWPVAPRAFRAWLGEAMAIKDPTEAVFRRQSGSNLLMVGQQEEAALGILVMALLSLAAQHSPADESNRSSGARFSVLDGTPADAPHAGTFARLKGYLPHPLQVGAWRDVSPVLTELSEEVRRRQKSNEVEGPSHYLLIYGLHRFRDLRRDEDDFGFSGSDDKPPSPSKQFSALLREGAALGIHCLVWCDSLNNVARALDRQSQREFEMRVLFQMSAADSSTLIDSPQAGRLGPHRALFHSEEEGRLEKFRPYGLPSDAWLGWVKEQLSRKRVAEPVREGV